MELFSNYIPNQPFKIEDDEMIRYYLDDGRMWKLKVKEGNETHVYWPDGSNTSSNMTLDKYLKRNSL